MKLLEQFQAYLKSSDRSSSAQFYGLDIQKFVLWFQEQHGCFDLAAITSLDLVEYRSYLQSHGGRRTKTHPTGQPAAPATVIPNC